MSQSQPLKLALVGSGSMGLNHARTIATGPHTSLVVVIDPSESNGRAAADQYGARWAPDLEALEGVDAAVVAAPTEHHKDLALQVIRGRPAPCWSRSPCVRRSPTPRRSSQLPPPPGRR